MSDETRWLTDWERDAWLALAGLMLKLPAALDAQMLRDSGLTLFDYFVLSNLSMSPERTQRLSDLAQQTSSSLSRLSNAAKRLEERGLLRRQPDPDNYRFTAAVLTDDGWDLVVAAAPGHVAAVRHFVIDGLTKEQVQTLREVACHVQRQVGDTPAGGATASTC